MKHVQQQQQLLHQRWAGDQISLNEMRKMKACTGLTEFNQYCHGDDYTQ
jgi:hypothetical protein